jgi:hypothetical protein
MASVATLRSELTKARQQYADLLEAHLKCEEDHKLLQEMKAEKSKFIENMVILVAQNETQSAEINQLKRAHDVLKIESEHSNATSALQVGALQEKAERVQLQLIASEHRV